MKVSVVALAIALACNSAAAQYPVSSGWGYFNKAEALRQAQFENQQWQRDQWQRERDYLWGGDSLDYGQRAANLRKTKQEARALRLQNDRMESQGNPYLNNPYER
jgi:hypothetical protein